MSPLLLLIFFTFFLISYIARTLRLRLQLHPIRGPPGLPLLGNAWEIVRGGNEKFINLLASYNEQFGQRYKLFLGMQPYIVIWNAGDAEKVLSSSVHIDKSKDYDFLMNWLGSGLLTSVGSKWHSRRKLLTPAFHFKILEDFIVIMNEQSRVLVEVLEEKADCQEARRKGFNIFPIVTSAALDVICETAMGKKIHAQKLKSENSDYVAAIYRISELIQKRQMNPFLQPDLFWALSSSGREEKKLLKVLHGFTEQVIKDRKEERQRSKTSASLKKKKKSKDEEEDALVGKKRRLAFLDLLLDAQEKAPGDLIDLEIRQEVDTFMFEGHDTTAASMNWTLFLLGHNQTAQAKVHEELDSIFQQQNELEITMDHLTKMKYLELCIKESLRLYPSVPFFGRRIDSVLELDDGGCLVPAGTMVMIMPHFLHRDPHYFPNPERFDPDRFLGEGDNQSHPFAYIPFSAGPRNCIGQKFAVMEEKVLLAQILHKFKVTSLESLDSLTLLAELITRPKSGLRVRLERRSPSPE